MFQQKRELVFPSVHFKLLILTCSIDTRSLITWRIPASGCRAWNPYWFEPASGVLSPPIPWHKHNHSLPPLLCRSGDVCHGDAVRLCARPLSDLVRSPPSVWQVKPLIWIDSVIEKFSHSRVEIKVKVGDKQIQTRTHTPSASVLIHSPSPLTETCLVFMTHASQVDYCCAYHLSGTLKTAEGNNNKLRCE